MSRHFDTTENAELRAKIDEARPGLPVPALMRRLGYDEKHIGKTALCPFHSDEHPSFSVFQSKNGKGWQWKCHVGCGYGDEIAFLVKHFNISRSEAIRRYLDMAGFPARVPPKSREYPERHGSHGFPWSHESPKSPKSLRSAECPVFPVSPVSNGQTLHGELVKVLKTLAAQNACTQLNTARTRRFKLLRDLKAVQKQIGRKLQIAELTIAFDEWHRLSLRFLDPAKTRDYYEAKFLSEFSKVRFATGDGTLMAALENIAKLSPDQLPEIPGKPNAPESWRRLAALHRELSRLRGKSTHFLAYRDGARVFDGMSHQEAHAITGALETLGVIKIVGKGKAGLNSREAAEFRCLLPETDNPAEEEEDSGLDL
jgi:CHC2-type zinc finger protein